MQSWLPCFPRPKSWSSDFIRTDVFLKNEAIRELNKFSRVGALGGEGQCSMSGRKYLFDECYHAVHCHGSPGNGTALSKGSQVEPTAVFRVIAWKPSYTGFQLTSEYTAYFKHVI